VSPQNKQDALNKLQQSGKGYTNDPSPHDRMQLILKGPTSNAEISSPTGSEAPHKHCQHHNLPQEYLQSTSRRIQKKLNSWNTPKRTVQILTSYFKGKLVNEMNCNNLCKYPVVYRDGEVRVVTNKRKLKKNFSIFMVFSSRVLKIRDD